MPSTESLRNRRVALDPTLTQISIGMSGAYATGFIGDTLLPPLPQDYDEAQLKKYGTEAYRMIDDAVGDHSRPEAIDTALTKLKIGVDGHALSTPVSDRERLVAANGPFRYDLANQNLAVVTANMLLRREFLQASLVTNSTVYPGANVVNLTAEKWDTVTGGVSDNDPVDDLLPWIARTIPRGSGVRPNTLWMGSAVWAALIQNTKIKGRIFGSNNAQPIPNETQIANLLGIQQVVVGQAISVDEAGVVTDLWGKFAGLMYVGPTAGEMLPSFGYTVEQKVFGSASVAVFRMRDEWMGPAGGWWIKRSAFYTPAVIFNAAGVIFTNVVV